MTRQTNGHPPAKSKKPLARFFRVAGISLLALLVMLAVIPYLIPLSTPAAPVLPYENSGLHTVDGRVLHYRTYLPPDGKIREKILLVHGLGGSTYSYEKNAPALADAGVAVITVDLPGFGYSSRHEDENHAQSNRAALLWSLLDHVNQDPAFSAVLSSDWHLGGHSMGGGTVAAMALARQTDTASLILIDGAVFENSRNGGISDVPVISRWLQVLLEHVFLKPARVEGFLTSAYGRPPTTEEVNGYLAPLSVAGTARSAPALLKTAKNVPAEELAGLQVPVIAIWGENDTWVPVSDTERIRVLITQLKISVIPDAGHCPMETHSEDFNLRLLEWVTSGQ